VASVESAAGARRRGRRTRSAIEPVEEAIVLSIFRLWTAERSQPFHAPSLSVRRGDERTRFEANTVSEIREPDRGARFRPHLR